MGVLADAIYAASERRGERPTASDQSIARAREIIRRFLQELPGEVSVAELRGELKELQ